MALRDYPDKFAVAFSFAGEERSQVLPIVQEVEGVLGRSTVFYDEWFEHHTAGPDSDLVLQDLYTRADLVVSFVSAAYADKAWTKVEHAAIRARLLTAGSPLAPQPVLRLRAGDGEVPGVLRTEIVPDIRRMTPTQSAELIVKKLNALTGRTTTAAEPPGWPLEPPELQWPMADHTQARTAFAGLLSERSTLRALLIRGTSETGKTHMSKQMLRNATSLEGVSCGRFDFKGTVDVGVQVEALSHQLGIEAPTGSTLNEQFGKILTELRRRTRPTVIILDTFEAAGTARDWVESVLLPHVCWAPWLRVVVVGQSVPDRLSTTWESMAPSTLTLRSPSPQEWFEYGVSNRGTEIGLDFVTQLHEQADGKPSLLFGLLGPRS